MKQLLLGWKGDIAQRHRLANMLSMSKSETPHHSVTERTDFREDWDDLLH
jgi:hypothetical protein